MNLWYFLCYLDKRQHIKVILNGKIVSNGMNKYLIDDYEETDIKITYIRFYNEICIIECEL